MSKKKRGGAVTSGGSVNTQHAATATHAAAVATHGAPEAPNASSLSMAPSSSTGGCSSNGSLDLVNRLLPFYNQLASDIASTPVALDRALWIHNVIAVVIQNMLMYDEHVGMTQLLMLLWAALWLGRAYIAASQAPPFVILGADRKRVGLWRVVLGVVGIAVHVPFLYFHDTPSRDRHVQLLLQIALVELMSVALLDRAKTRVTWEQILLATLEALIVTSIFSVLYNHKEELIYDHIAFALTGLSVLTHTFVLLTAKFVALSQSQSQSQSRELSANWSQQRGHRLVAELRHAADLTDNEDENDAEPVVKQVTHLILNCAWHPSQQPCDDAANDDDQATLCIKNPAAERERPDLLAHDRSGVSAAAADRSVDLPAALLGDHKSNSNGCALMVSYNNSVLMLSSAHVLWTLQQLHEKLLKPLPQALETASA